MNELVSIIVPVYGVEKYLNKCVERLVEQSYKNVEIVLIDDGSKDNSGKICDEWARKDCRILVVHQENRGLAGARNSGVKVSKGEYIAFVDSDDFVEKDFIQVLVTLCKSKEADIAITNYNIIDSKSCKIIASGKNVGKIFEWSPYQTLKYRSNSKEYFIGTIVWNKLFKRELIEKMSFPEGKLYEDTVYTYDAITRAKKIVYVDRPLYNYRTNREGSILNGGVNYERLNSDLFPLLQKRSLLLRERGYEEIAINSDYKACESIVTYIEIARSTNCIEQISMLKGWMDIFFNICKNKIGIWNRVCLFHVCPIGVVLFDYFIEKLRKFYRKIRRT